MLTRGSKVKNDDFSKDCFCDFIKFVQVTSGSEIFSTLQYLIQSLQAVKILSIESSLSGLCKMTKFYCKRLSP